MNKYDFDFRRIEDVLYDVLGIVNPTDIISLKMQIRESLNSLSEAIDKKAETLDDATLEKIESQKQALYNELDSVATSSDLDAILRKCIKVRFMSLLSLEYKIRDKDSYEEKSRKQAKRGEIFAVSDMERSVPSFVELMENRTNILSHIDGENRQISFNTSPDPALLDGNPNMKIDIQFQHRPDGFPDEYAKCLEEAGIYAYNFGDVVCFDTPNQEGDYLREVTRKKLVGVIKRDEFGELKKYSILMNDDFGEISPEFLRDILFSDVLLRNAKNNQNFLGVPRTSQRDREYGFKVGFSEEGLEEFLRAIYFENNPNMVKVESNFLRVKGVSEACRFMQEKMEQAINELQGPKKDEGKSMGDD